MSFVTAHLLLVELLNQLVQLLNVFIFPSIGASQNPTDACAATPQCSVIASQSASESYMSPEQIDLENVLEK